MIKDNNIRDGIGNVLVSLKEICEDALDNVVAGQFDSAMEMIKQVQDAVTQLGVIARPYKDECNVKVCDVCTCIYDSTKDLIQLLSNTTGQSVQRAINKIRFEVLELIRIGYLDYQYWGCCYPDEDKIEEFKQAVKGFDFIPAVHEAKANGGNYRYDLSVMITGYNHSDWTKQCVKSVLKYMPKDITYELILLNHGSTDDTKRYFESVCPTKQIDFSVNRAIPGLFQQYEGKYVLNISNDVIVTENAIQNMYKILQNDKSVGFIVPSTNNVSNMQDLFVEYGSLFGLNNFAHINNVYDVSKHEQRNRLCNPIFCAPAELMNCWVRDLYCTLYCNPKVDFAFPDDQISLWMRRHNYKLILAKDAYCHHGGSITIGTGKNNEADKTIYYEGAVQFQKNFGVNPWGIGVCYDIRMLELLEFDLNKSSNILGIECGLGANPLKIKEYLKEQGSTYKSFVYNITECTNFVKDMQGISDFVYYDKNIIKAMKSVENIQYDYIVIESQKFKAGFYDELLKVCNTGSQIIIHKFEDQEYNIPADKFDVVAEISEWIKLKVKK